jgi:hypothetical protein
VLEFQEQLLKEELSQLPPSSRVAFAASCAQRLVSVYHEYVAQTDPPSGARLDHALEYVWTHLLTCPNEERTQRVLADVMALIPDEETPGWTPLTPYAEDATSALAYSLRCLLSGDAQEAAWAARRVYEALDEFVVSRDDISPSDPGAEYGILRDPVIQAELERQKRDISDLRSAGKSPSPRLIECLRVRSFAEQVIVLGR